MNCHEASAAIVDEGFSRPPGFRAHLEQCPRCQELARLHASAINLRLPGPPAIESISRREVLSEVRRRKHLRRAVAGAAVTAAVATGVLFMLTGTEPAAVPAPGPLIAQRTEKPPAPLVEEAEPASLGLLLEEIDGYTRRNPAVQDETYAPFGALALWVRPPDSIALDDRPFRTALAPLHPASPTQEPSR
ncbi:MAG TPA: hypothetical protein VF815_16430 [Myxococcaceae bacterium]|jgi:hypothetical protein